MGMFDIFRRKKPDKKSSPVKRQTRPGRQKQIREAGKKRKIAKTKEGRRFPRWARFPWWRKLLTVLGIIGIGLAIWFIVQSSCLPTPTHHLGITINPAGSGSVSPIHGYYSDGAQVTLTATPASGYEFASWSGDASGTSPTATITMSSNKDVTANFRVIQYTLATSISPPEGGSTSPSSGSYDGDSSFTLTATPSSGYEFVSWSGDASGTNPTVTITMDSDKNVVANFVTIMQEITYTMPTGTISGSVVSFSNILNRGDIVEGFVELTGQYYTTDWSFRWTFEILAPEGRRVDVFHGHWVRRNHHDFSFTAPYTGSYKIRVRHNSSYDKYLVIKIRPKGW